MKKSTKSTYTVGLDMKFSHQYVVEAKTAAEAKKKAFARFKATRNTISQYNIDVDKEL